ncbi:endo alpha-1,4 polygalactosaminidase [Dermatophilaceae bacterium Soc4.6]
MTTSPSPFDVVALRVATSLLSSAPAPFRLQRMSSFAHWFHDADDDVLVAVAVPGAPARAAAEVLASGLAWRGHRSLRLVLLPTQVTQLRLKLPWVETDVRVWTLAETPGQGWDVTAVPSVTREQALAETAPRAPREMSLDGVAPSQRRRSLAMVAGGVLLLVVGPWVGSAHAGGSTPSAPTGLNGTTGAASVGLDWTAPASAGFTIGEYHTQYSTNGGSSWSGNAYTGTAVTHRTYSGLTNGQIYVFRVRAENTSTAGAWSTDSAPMVPTTSPSPTPTGTTTTTSSPTPTSTLTPPPSSWWSPAQGTTWQWQLSGKVDTTVSVPVYDIDGDANTAATVATLHAAGAKVICYIDAGGWENYRSDAASFPDIVKGNTMAGWPDERWLDIRQTGILVPLMEKRVQTCVAKGFDAMEFDVADGYTNKTGFPLTGADQLTYNKALAAVAHRYGLGAALKNDAEQVVALQPFFDFAIVEQCFQYKECATYSPFVAAGKAVLETEYKGTTSSFCPTMKSLGFSSTKKYLRLDAWREAC